MKKNTARFFFFKVGFLLLLDIGSQQQQQQQRVTSFYSAMKDAALQLPHPTPYHEDP
jgi:hypothetical protein